MHDVFHDFIVSLAGFYPESSQYTDQWRKYPVDVHWNALLFFLLAYGGTYNYRTNLLFHVCIRMLTSVMNAWLW